MCACVRACVLNFFWCCFICSLVACLLTLLWLTVIVISAAAVDAVVTINVVMMIPVEYEYVAVVIIVRYYCCWLTLIMLVCSPHSTFMNSLCEFIHYRRIRTSYWSFNKSIIKFIKWKEKLAVLCVCVCVRPVPRRLHCSLTTWGTFISLSNASQFRFLSNDWIRVCVNTSITYTHSRESGCVRITWTHIYSIDEVDPLLIV